MKVNFATHALFATRIPAFMLKRIKTSFKSEFVSTATESGSGDYVNSSHNSHFYFIYTTGI